MLAAVTAVAIVTAVSLTHLGPAPIGLTLELTTLFFITMAGRFTPAMALISNAVEPRYRGGFMSVNSAVQHAASGLANLTAGAMVSREGLSGRLVGYPLAGKVAVGAFLLTLGLAWRLRAAAPHAARPGRHPGVPAPVVAD